MKTSSLLLVIGIGILVYSCTLEPYSNYDLFYEQYMALDHSQSSEFYALRDEMVTPKYLLQDIGISLILFFLIAKSLLKLGKGKIVTPSKPLLIALAFVLPLLTAAGSVFDLFQGLFRGEFPHWADSIAIPLAGVPIIFTILLVWSMSHLLFISVSQTPITKMKIVSLHISLKTIPKLNRWILFISCVTFILTALSAVYGQYWVSVPGTLWLYYYLSLGTIRLNAPNKLLKQDS